MRVLTLDKIEYTNGWIFVREALTQDHFPLEGVVVVVVHLLWFSFVKEDILDVNHDHNHPILNCLTKDCSFLVDANLEA